LLRVCAFIAPVQAKSSPGRRDGGQGVAGLLTAFKDKDAVFFYDDIKDN